MIRKISGRGEMILAKHNMFVRALITLQYYHIYNRGSWILLDVTKIFDSGLNKHLS